MAPRPDCARTRQKRASRGGCRSCFQPTLAIAPSRSPAAFLALPRQANCCVNETTRERERDEHGANWTADNCATPLRAHNCARRAAAAWNGREKSMGRLIRASARPVREQASRPAASRRRPAVIKFAASLRGQASAERAVRPPGELLLQPANGDHDGDDRLRLVIARGNLEQRVYTRGGCVGRRRDIYSAVTSKGAAGSLESIAGEFAPRGGSSIKAAES